MRYDLGYFNLEQKTPQQPENGPARSDRAGPRVKGLSYKCSRVSIPARTGICEIGSWPQTNFLVTFESSARLRRSGVLLRKQADASKKVRCAAPAGPITAGGSKNKLPGGGFVRGVAADAPRPPPCGALFVR